MSTQQADLLPFSLAQEQQNFRLIELTPDLLELLSQPDPPTLSIKSASKSTNAATNTTTVTTAHLCTANKTYAFRSIGTSNSLFVVHPQSIEDQQDGLPRQGITAIGQCAITLELLSSTESAKEYLHALLPIWHRSGTAVSDDQKWTKPALIDDIPLSIGEIDYAWRDMCIFEDDKGLITRPAPTEVLALWRSTVAAAYAESLDLENFHVDELWTAVQDEGYPRSLFNAMIMRIIKPGATLQALDLKAAVDPETAVVWVGTLLLESHAQTLEGTPNAKFETEWVELVPDAWIGLAKMEVLDGLVVRPSPGHIMLKDVHDSLKKKAVGTGGAGTNRKWHDKFKKKG